jgi:outer membrane protein TolC
MSDADRKKLLVGLEAEYRRTETALAIAQADFENAYTALCSYMNEQSDGPRRVLALSPGITMH